MEDMSASRWKRRGSSVVFHKVLLGPLISETGPVSLRSALHWLGRWPAEPPGGVSTVLVAGLEACLDVMESSDAEEFLRSRVHPFLLEFQRKWEQCGLIFGFACPPQRFGLDPQDQILFHSQHGNRDPVRVSQSLWGGAANNQLYRLVGTDPATGRDVIGGYHVGRVS